MTEADVWALGQSALGTIDMFAPELLSVRYREQDLRAAEKNPAT